ncbi:MAG: 50S ribosomal protein L4 [bacterium]|nr:50S ribosomal protein L4 [bacterium]
MESIVYNQKGEQTRKITLPESVFGVKWNADLVHQVMQSMMVNLRTPVAHSRTRGEVRGGGKKPWQQKGTGRARHGSRRSPLWVGGGVTHGPRNDKNLYRKINRKMKTGALFSVLSAKLKDGEIVFIDKINFEKPRTKDALSVLLSLEQNIPLKGISKKKENAVCLALSKKDDVAKKCFANIRNVSVSEVRNLNILTLLNSKFIVIENPDYAIPVFQNKLALRKNTGPSVS